MGKIAPGVAVLAVVLPYGAPLPFAHIGAPAAPILRPVAESLQATAFWIDRLRHPPILHRSACARSIERAGGAQSLTSWAASWTMLRQDPFSHFDRSDPIDQ